MLKISQAGMPNHSVTLKLEGRVVGPWVNELRLISDSLLSNGRLVKLDLSDVSFADSEGLLALKGLKYRGVKLLSATPFLAEQLKSVTGDALSSS